MRVIVVLALCLSTVAAAPSNPQKIVGGALITINQQPSLAALLFTWDLRTYWHVCGGTIITARAVVTAAHCLENGDPADRWRIRVGSSFANSGGYVHTVATYTVHPSYNFRTLDHDLAIMRVAVAFTLGTANIRASPVAAANYNVANNLAVWAAGWGTTTAGGQFSEQLRRVELRVIAPATCRQNYAAIGKTITANVVCGGWAAGGRGPCLGDSGGPLLDNWSTLVGVYSWGQSCGIGQFPGVNTRVPSYNAWIHANA